MTEKDREQEKADEIMIANGYTSSNMHKEIAAALREAKAEAYEHAAFYSDAKNAELFNRLAAALRRTP